MHCHLAVESYRLSKLITSLISHSLFCIILLCEIFSTQIKGDSLNRRNLCILIKLSYDTEIIALP